MNNFIKIIENDKESLVEYFNFKNNIIYIFFILISKKLKHNRVFNFVTRERLHENKIRGRVWKFTLNYINKLICLKKKFRDGEIGWISI